jgi:SOS-response transcriptional repressor LexA
MRFNGLQRVERRIPVVAFAAEKRVWVEASILSQLLLREAWSAESGSEPLHCVDSHNGTKSISQYALQQQKHTLVCRRAYKPRQMEKSADGRREILRRFIKERGFKIARWAKEAGVDKNSIYNFLNGHSQSLDLRTYGKLARVAECPVWRLTGDEPEPQSPTAIWVIGSVEAGAFREAVEWDQSLWFIVDIPVPDRFRGKAKALQVRGTSMNSDYPEGSIAVWVDTLDFRPARPGDDVVVYSHNGDGKIEATLKELRADDSGKRWLWPRSHDPLHQTPIDIASPPREVREIEIKGIVIGCYRSWHN